MEYIKNYYAYIGYSTPFDFEKALEAEKIFDNLSIIRSHETPQQWADRVRSTLRILINEKYSSYYHVFCLFGSFVQGVTETCYNNCMGKEILISYYRSVYNNKMTICFDCWKLIKVEDIKPKKTYFNGWRRYGYEIKSEDLMKYHWDNECSKANIENRHSDLIFTSNKSKNIIPTSYIIGSQLKALRARDH
ncbi:hypothetical protein GLOIN_2v986619 [Rhizophagus clarus]|nr:hypothetical protein GLOIN_2v986619 [Rhizophagus clarus]